MDAIFNEESVSTILHYYSSADIELFREFLANHYPQIKPIWDRIARISEEIDATDHRLTRFIDQRILTGCESSGIKHRKNK